VISVFFSGFARPLLNIMKF